MMKYRIGLILLLVCSLLTASAAAAYGTVEGNGETAAIIIADDSVAQNNAGFKGTVSARKEISASQLVGVYIEGSGTDNGIVIKKTDGGTVSIGSKDCYYDTDGDFILDADSVIILNGPTEDPNDEGKSAAGILVDAVEGSGVLTVDRAYIKTSGYRAPTIISRNSDISVVFRHCRLISDGADKSFIPNFKLLSGTARTTCLMNENTWFYNTVILAKDWGAVSLDTTPYANIYMLNSYAEARSGGYGLYAVNGTTSRLYGSKLLGSQYGMFLMGNGSVIMDNLAAADDEALKYQDYVNLTDGTLTKDGSSLVAGAINAAVVHVNSGVGQAGLKNPATLTVKNSTLSTMPEDLESMVGSDMTFVDYEDYLKNPIKDCGASWFYLEYSKGSLVFARSAGVNITFGEGAVLKPANGVIFHSAIGYDSGAGNIYNDSSLKLADKISQISLKLDTPVVGDIIHDDYQRYMNVDVNADYKGAITSGTIKTWNALWSDSSLEAMLEDGGYTSADFDVAANGDEIRKNLIREQAYPKTYGAVVKLADGVSWDVTGSCSMSSLTIGEGSALNLPVGYSIYVNCDSDYNYLTGQKLDKLEPGATYKMVAITFPTGYYDVSRNDWYFAEVMKASELGLFDGIGDGRFMPEANLTIAQAIKLAVSVDMLKNAGTVTKLTAKDGESWYQPYVDYALENGIIPESFESYNSPATRGEAAYIFSGVVSIGAGTQLDKAIADVSDDYQYSAEIKALYGAGIFTGYSDMTFRPDAHIRRREIAAMLARLLAK